MSVTGRASRSARCRSLLELLEPPLPGPDPPIVTSGCAGAAAVSTLWTALNSRVARAVSSAECPLAETRSATGVRRAFRIRVLTSAIAERKAGEPTRSEALCRYA
jgi:hypothetical protein